MSAVTEKVVEVNEIKTETVKSNSESDSDSEDVKLTVKQAKKVKKELSEAKKLQLGNARKARSLKARQKALEEKSKLENIEVQIDSIEKKSSAPPKVPVEETSSFDYYALLIPVIGFGSLLLTKYLEKKSENLKKVEVLAVEEVAAAPQALNFFS
jgi:predicted nuclease with TOPRIM domain